LATPGVRFDSAGRAVSAYAGDLLGNVWEFDLSSTSSASWGVANSGDPFFTATDGAGNAQPITAPVSMAVNDVPTDPHFGQLFVYVGTGSNFQVGDPATTRPQTLYGLIDRGTTITRNQLRERMINNTGTFDGRPVRTFAAATAGDMVGMSGFRLELASTGADAGERIVTRANYFRLAEPVLLFSSIIPVSNLCTPGGRGYLNAIGAFTGARLTRPIFDINRTNGFTDDLLNGVFIGSLDLGVGMPGEATLVGRFGILGGTSGGIGQTVLNLGVTPVTGRMSWREIVRD
jgi:type IV pilus assembly protein PilY1